MDALPHPGGLGIWAEEREVTFLLEYDTGSEHLPRLAAKLDGYAALASDASRQRAARIRLPLLFCFLTPPGDVCPPGPGWQRPRGRLVIV
jgi:hypothetical protein